MAPSTISVPLFQYEPSQRVFTSLVDSKPAGLPVTNPTRSFWIDSPNANPLGSEGSKGPLTDDTDICIIGSGITGVSAAWHLGRMLKSEGAEKKSVVILEARDFCSGATGRNGGHLTPGAFIEFLDREALYGTSEAVKSFHLEEYTTREIVNILESENLGAAVDLVKGGHTTVFVTEDEKISLSADFEAAKAAGMKLEGVRWLSKDEMENTYGTPFHGVHSPGYNLWPLKFVTELFKLARNKFSSHLSINLHTRTPVTSISSAPPSSNPTRRWVLTTPRGRIQCTTVIHATNAYASHLLPQLSGPAGIIPTKGQVIALRANAGLEKLTKSSWSGNEGFEYWFPRPVGKENGDKPLVILGGGREVHTLFGYNDTDDSEVDSDVGDVLRRFLPGIFPGRYEPGREPEIEWTGIMGFTQTGDPFVGPVIGKGNDDQGKFVGQYIAAGYTGHGMPRAYACAEVVAGMVVAEFTGDRNKWKAPKWLPQHYLTLNRDVKTGY